MIIVRITGGMGNQMFQYAIGRMLSEKLHKDLFLDISFYKNQNTDYTGFAFRNYELDNYYIKANLLDCAEYDVYKDFCVLRDEKFYMFYDEIMNLSSSNNYILMGLWQSWKYFEPIKESIRDELTLSVDKLSNKGKELLSLIKKNTSVALHIRRTDYGELGYLPSDYYRRAIHNMSNEIDNPLYFIFSDAPDEAEEIISQLDINHMIVKDLDNIEDQYLMSSCQHNIIANSTFSWWAAWLNTNPLKKIIVPKQWFPATTNDVTYEDLMPKEWVCL